MLKSSHLSRAHSYLDHASKASLVDNSNKHLSKSNEKNVIFQSTVIGIEWICCEPNEKTNRNSNKHSMNLKVFFRIEWLFLWSNQKHRKIQRILFLLDRDFSESNQNLLLSKRYFSISNEYIHNLNEKFEIESIIFSKLNIFTRIE